MASESILVINAGSSSIKFTLFDVEAGEVSLHYDGRIQPDTISFDLFLQPSIGIDKEYGGQVEGIGTAPKFKAKDRDNELVYEETWAAGERSSGHQVALEKLMRWLDDNLGDTTLIGVGHRVVHGGTEYAAPTIVNDEVLQQLESYTVLAPLHQPNCLAGIRAMLAMRPDLPQVACFDTAFHRNHPLVADQFALPYELYEEGVRRYGFHGLSYAYIAHTLPTVAPELADGRVVVAHLGSGASMCALKGGQSMDSTMGFTALMACRWALAVATLIREQCCICSKKRAWMPNRSRMCSTAVRGYSASLGSATICAIWKTTPTRVRRKRLTTSSIASPANWAH